MQSLNGSQNLKNYRRHDLENWENENIYYKLDNSIMLILNFLGLIFVLWVCGKMHLFLKIFAKIFSLCLQVTVKCYRGENIYREKEHEWEKVKKFRKMLIIGEYR